MGSREILDVQIELPRNVKTLSVDKRQFLFTYWFLAECFCAFAAAGDKTIPASNFVTDICNSDWLTVAANTIGDQRSRHQNVDLQNTDNNNDKTLRKVLCSVSFSISGDGRCCCRTSPYYNILRLMRLSRQPGSVYMWQATRRRHGANLINILHTTTNDDGRSVASKYFDHLQ